MVLFAGLLAGTLIRGSAFGQERETLLERIPSATTEERTELLYQLIALAPGAAIRLASAPPQDNQSVVVSHWSGSVSTVVSDDFETGQSSIHHFLDVGDEHIEVFFANPSEYAPGEMEFEGVRIRDRIAVETVTARVADALQCVVEGVQNMLVVMVTMPAFPTFPLARYANLSVPYTPEFLRDVFFGPQGTLPFASLDQFIRESSYGKTSVQGRIVGPISLTRDYACDAIHTPAIAAADGLVDFREYTRIAFIFPALECRTSSGQTFSGLGTVGCNTYQSPSKGPFSASISWLPVSTGSFAGFIPPMTHEFGHNLGLGHANSETFANEALGPVGIAGTRAEYGDRVDAMGGGRGQYSGPHKSLDLGWLRSEEIRTVDGPGTYNIVPFENASGVRALRILRDADTNTWLWAEYRQPIGDVDKAIGPAVDSNQPTVYNGITVRHEVVSTLSYNGRSDGYFLDFSPQTPSTTDFTMTSNTPWTDPYSPLRLSVVNANADGLSLQVSYDSPCAKATPSQSTYPGGNATGTVSVAAPANCSWTATSKSDWITLTGTPTGRGNGSFGFALTANGTAQRIGSIALEQQTLRVNQEGIGTNVIGMSPSNGTGSTGTFTFRFSHSSGGAATREIWIDFAYGNESRCWIAVNGANLSLRERESRFSGVGRVTGSASLFGASGTLSSRFCSLSLSQSSYRVNGNEVEYTLQLSFPEAYAGTHRVWIQTAQPNVDITASLIQAIGSWTVPSCKVTPTANAFAAPGTGIAAAIDINADPACFWAASSEAQWIQSQSQATGAAKLAFSVAPNGSVNPRTGTIRIGQQTITVTQAGGPSSFTFSPQTRTVAAPATIGQVTLTASDGASWSLASTAPWLVITSAINGTGNTTVSYRTEPNLTLTARTANISANGSLFTLTQLGSATAAISSVNTVGGPSAISENGWIEIKGNRLVPTTTPAAGVIWSNAPEFAQGKMPTTLGGVQVTINGKPAYIYFFCSAVTSPVCKEDQINVLTPLDDSLGDVLVVVASGNVSTPAFP